MMRADNLKEFAQALRVGADNRQADFGTEILDLLDLEEAIAQPYYDLCDDIEYRAPDHLKGDAVNKHARIVEWLRDRSDLLAEIECHFKEADLAGDVDDLVRQLLAERPDPLEYDL